MAKKAELQDDPKSLAASLYKQNVEILGKNKTLSLLSKLYEISILTLDSRELAVKISEVVQVDLSFDSVGILLFSKEKEQLFSLAFKNSERIEAVVAKEKFSFNELNIKLSDSAYFTYLIQEKRANATSNLSEVWGKFIPPDLLAKIEKEGHIKTTSAYPLLIQNDVIGVLIFSFNRSVSDLSEHEREAMESTINVVAVALDKALLYEKLEEANKQLLALDKARAEFISIASHQLRTPPATIKWYLGAVLAGDFGQLSEELTAAIKRANVTNETQIATIDDLLNASRIERGKLEFFFEPGQLEPLVSGLVEQLQPLAQMKKQTIEYTKPSATLPDIMMDKEKVRQVLNNMIDNAIKYSKQGIIKVALTSTADDLIVSVTDTGKGIAKSELPGIFEKYTRGHDSVTHATGLGLGMYVAKVIVDQHHGKIWADSPGVGKGATFSFSLPIHSNVQATTVDLAQPN